MTAPIPNGGLSNGVDFTSLASETLADNGAIGLQPLCRGLREQHRWANHDIQENDDHKDLTWANKDKNS